MFIHLVAFFIDKNLFLISKKKEATQIRFK